MNIFAIGAHPDDIEVGCGGTLIQYAQKEHSVFVLVCTLGEKGGMAKARNEEQLKAAEIMGVKEVFLGNFRDTDLHDKGNEIIHMVEGYIDSIKPDVIFVNFFDDTHQDHRRVNKSVLSATRYVKNVLFYEVPTTSNFFPNIYVDIGSVLGVKIEALKAHASQVMKTNIPDLSILDIARASANFRGVQARIPFAEAFVSQRLFLQIN